MKKNKLLVTILGVSTAVGVVTPVMAEAKVNNTENVRLYTSNTEKFYTGTVRVKPGSSLNIRSSATTSSSKIGSFKNGEVIKIYGNVGKWCEVRVNGQRGFVSEDYVEITHNNASSSNNGAMGQIGPSALVNVKPGSSLNVRSGASTSASIIASLKNGEKVIVGAEKGDWCEVYYNGNKTGYVNKHYLNFGLSNESSSNNTNSNTNNNTSSEKFYTGTVRVKPGYSLNIRSTASVSSSKIGSFKNGEVIKIYGNVGRWCEVKVNGQRGFVSEDYVEITHNNASSSNNGAMGQFGETALVNVKAGSTLNVRSGASTSASVIGSLKRGEKVFVGEEKGEWCKVQYSGGRSGYVSSKYLNFGR